MFLIWHILQFINGLSCHVKRQTVDEYKYVVSTPTSCSAWWPSCGGWSGRTSRFCRGKPEWRSGFWVGLTIEITAFLGYENHGCHSVAFEVDFGASYLFSHNFGAFLKIGQKVDNSLFRVSLPKTSKHLYFTMKLW